MLLFQFFIIFFFSCVSVKLRDLIVGKLWSACAGVINPVKPSDLYV